jgi:predicted regulator of Ras-like GTPase activity (Roadblock/LC7/MglB family)
MTPYMLAWMLSLLAAALFFGAGLFFARHRTTLTSAKATTPQSLRSVEDDFPSDVRASGDALRAVLARESDRSGLTGAVIADELGLVVASTGELSDALAAYGAVLAGVGAKTREGLPLQHVRQVQVKDDHDMTLTVRKIASVDEEFALVTLTAGQEQIVPQVAVASGR